MTGALTELIEAARLIRQTPEQREEQRRSFAYGNTAFGNSRITREMIAEQAERLAREEKCENDADSTDFRALAGTFIFSSETIRRK